MHLTNLTIRTFRATKEHIILLTCLLKQNTVLGLSDKKCATFFFDFCLKHRLGLFSQVPIIYRFERKIRYDLTLHIKA